MKLFKDSGGSLERMGCHCVDLERAYDTPTTAGWYGCSGVVGRGGACQPRVWASPSSGILVMINLEVLLDACHAVCAAHHAGLESYVMRTFDSTATFHKRRLQREGPVAWRL